MKRKPGSAIPTSGRSTKPKRAPRGAEIKNPLAAVPPSEAHELVRELAAHASPLSLVHPAAEVPGFTLEPSTAKTPSAPPPRARRGAGSVDPLPASREPTQPLQTVLPQDAADQGGPSKRVTGRPPVKMAGRKAPASTPTPESAETAVPGDGVPSLEPNLVSESSAARLADAQAAASPSSTSSHKPDDATQTAAASGSPGDIAADPLALPDVEALARNMGRLIENSGKAAAAYLQPREKAGLLARPGEELVQTMNSLGKVAESWLSNPARMFQAQAALSTQLFSLWNSSIARFNAPPQAEEPRVTDKRFAAPEWRETPFFDFLHQAYLVTTDWAKAMVADAEGVDPATREKASFYLRQISSALSPSNFLATNPELLKETIKEKGENLVRGMQMLAEDIEAGKGDLKIRQTDATKFNLGVDMAATPGKVVFRNELMELIQYAPTTDVVLKRPLLIVPPWINKFYVLDLNAEKSFVRWVVSQGVTVFIISWVNPDERHAQKDWDAYMREGIFEALDAIEQAVGEREVTAVGYCVGGTLLAATLAYMAAKGDTRVTSSTFLTTQVDFQEAGDLKVFADEAQIRTIEQQMADSGYLAGSRMANAFNMLRPDDLIWSYSVNTYLKGQAPRPFDLLTWNADSTRMSAANHAFYLRNCYLENKLTRGEMVLGGEKLDLSNVTIPIYDLAAKEDHIAPARSVFTGSRFFGGPVRYVLAGSGHIAGVVNPPAKAKYQYWTDGRTDGDFATWVETATERPGTWWLDWIAWVREQAPATVPARVPGAGGLAAICDAPGEYVRVQS